MNNSSALQLIKAYLAIGPSFSTNTRAREEVLTRIITR